MPVCARLEDRVESANSHSKDTTRVEEAQHGKATDCPFQAPLTLRVVREGRAMRADSAMGCMWGLRSELQRVFSKEPARAHHGRRRHRDGGRADRDGARRLPASMHWLYSLVSLFAA